MYLGLVGYLRQISLIPKIFDQVQFRYSTICLLINEKLIKLALVDNFLDARIMPENERCGVPAYFKFFKIYYYIWFSRRLRHFENHTCA